jgi:hypothetical protein
MAPYSARNPIPNVKQFTEEFQKRLDLQKLGPKDDDSKSKNKGNKTRRQVVDPTTKSNVIIQDVQGDFESPYRRPEVHISMLVLLTTFRLLSLWLQ